VHQTRFELVSLVDTAGKRKDFAETYVAPDLRRIIMNGTDDHPNFRARFALWLSVIYVVALTVTEISAKRAMDDLKQAVSDETKPKPD